MLFNIQVEKFVYLERDSSPLLVSCPEINSSDSFAYIQNQCGRILVYFVL